MPNQALGQPLSVTSDTPTELVLHRQLLLDHLNFLQNQLFHNLRPGGAFRLAHDGALDRVGRLGLAL